MIGNPEFRRNLWTQFSSTRVLVGALLTGLLLLCALAADLALTTRRAFVPDITAFVARWLAIVILLFWAGRQAAGAVLREIRARTWDAQRLSTIHPWSMAWGKLFGTTALAWTMALVSAVAYVAADLTVTYTAAGVRDRQLTAVLVTAASILGFGVVCQATGLLASLARLSGRPGEGGGGTTLAHAVALIATGLLSAFVVWALERQGRWFGLRLGEEALRLVTIWFFAIWTIVGVYRRMRRELQMQSMPWAWLLFLITLVVYGEGLAYGRGQPQIALLLPMGIVMVMLWAMTFIEAKDPLTLRQCMRAFGRGQWRHAATLVPLWLVTYVVFALIVAASIALTLTGSAALRDFRIPGEASSQTLLILVATFLFATRDVLIVQIFTLGREANLAGLSGAVIWFVFYFAIPALAIAGQQQHLLGVVLPTGQGGWMLCLVPAAVEAVLCLALFAWRWRAYWRENAAKAPAA